ncbi:MULTISPECIES: ketopantoate reductase family protein [Rhizobium]|uniref:ketopantoate reductase family protein n=1 Tax=Rhizobium TaxID=379 RepID=UPI001105E7C5|nr:MULTISPECIES: 2-dehydropantoate 2-reductase [Rhizobium]MBX4894850.1 2-dehydropantoate 2-reductase [Rhizobium bangladeshense]MBX4904036.1 2-dehydropantoate 2-reductase [Rhizobium bangladeshense]MBY3613683.1 2-dehydropantoate 2-reductase [Rhizobium bangladeshense]QSY95981.1 2-dehydropantoate 2-reductase [Rhizobium bangladeshense]TLW97571.1 2-dehydropantoate 2-reductase [Rhizobium sp. MHM7A]
MSIKTICIYGAGALGGAIAAKLASREDSDIDVSVVARGAHLDAIRRDGLSLQEADAETPLTVRVTATEDPKTLPAQDLVITGLKGHQLPLAAEGIAALLKQGTRVVMILNGIPWWYFHRDTRSGHAELQFDELDPGGGLWRLIGPERVIGCVAYQGAEVVSPGEIRLSHKGRFVLGEPSGEMSADLAAVAAVLTGADLSISTTPDIRSEIWSKLMGNAAFNPISALTRALMTDILADPALMDMVSKVMKEVRAVGDAVGAQFAMSVEQRLEQSRHIGGVRTSMLQDLLGGKALEIAPLVGMLVALGRLTAVPTPVSETILALVTQLDRENRRGN